MLLFIRLLEKAYPSDTVSTELPSDAARAVLAGRLKFAHPVIGQVAQITIHLVISW